MFAGSRLRPLTRWVGLLPLLVVAVALLASTASAKQAATLRVALLTPALANDGSFNQVALEAVQRLQAEGLITYELREKMADPATSEPVVRDYAAQGFDLIIGHGIELSEPVLKVAAEFPNVHFAISGGSDVVTKATDNVEAWTYSFPEQGYLSGFVASKLGATTIGIVGGPQLPFIVAAHNGFKAAVQENNPDAHVQEVFTGNFDDAQKAAEATKGLIAQGATLVWCSGDGICNGVAAAANDGNILTLGITGDAGGLQQKVNVASVELNMYPTYRSYVDRVLSGQFGNAAYVSTIANSGLVLTPVNFVNSQVPADLQAQVDQLAADLASGARQLPSFEQ
jgi:simple sugar transport system substrate-binding protein/basic membrane protein A